MDDRLVNKISLEQWSVFSKRLFSGFCLSFVLVSFILMGQALADTSFIYTLNKGDKITVTSLSYSNGTYSNTLVIMIGGTKYYPAMGSSYTISGNNTSVTILDQTNNGTRIPANLADGIRSGDGVIFSIKFEDGTNSDYNDLIAGFKIEYAPPPPPTYYTLTTGVSNDGGGSVSKNPNQSSYLAGTSVTVTANPSQGYAFAGWSGDSQATTRSITLTMNSNKSVTAIFSRINYYLTTQVKPDQSGSVAGQGSYASYTQATLTATAADKYRFKNWTENGNVVGTSNPLTVNMESDHTICANFERMYQLSAVIKPADSGIATVSGTGTYVSGQTANLAAQALKSNVFFKAWKEGDSLLGNNSTLVVTMNNDRQVTAEFGYNYTVTAVAKPTVAAGQPQPGILTGAGTYREGSRVTVQAANNQGWTFKNWTENNSEATTESEYSFILTGNRTLNAQFERVYHNLTVTIELPEGGTVTGQGKYAEGDTAILAIKANPGYKCALWGEDSSSPAYIGSGDANVQIRMNRDYRFKVYFKNGSTWRVNTYVYPDVVGLGAGKLEGAGDYPHNTNVNIAAKANPGWQFEKFRIQGVSTSEFSAGERFAIYVNENLNITAYFKPKKCKLITQGNHGIIEKYIGFNQKTDADEFAYGEEVKVKAKAESGYIFKRWKGDLSSAQANETISMNGDKDITACFAPVSQVIDTYMIQNDADTFILEDYKAAFPEVQFITIAAIKTKADGKLELAKNNPDPIKVKIAGPEISSLHYTMVPLKIKPSGTEAVLISDNSVQQNKFTICNALSESEVSQLGSELEDLKVSVPENITDGQHELNLDLNSSGYAVVAVFVWDYSKFKTALKPFGSPDGSIDYFSGSFTTKIDTISLERSGIPSVSRPGYKGKFVIKGTSALGSEDNRLCSNLLAIMWKQVHGEKITLSSNKVPDWIEVAAANIYNDPIDTYENSIFDMVDEISALPIGSDGAYGMCIDGKVLINQNRKCVRLNTKSTNGYSFTSLNQLLGTIRHESLHAYHHKANPYSSGFTPSGLYDADEDGLFAKDTKNGMNEYLKFSWDNIKRGFVKIPDMFSFAKFDLLRNKLDWGDGYKLEKNERFYNYHLVDIIQMLSAEELSDLVEGKGIDKDIPSSLFPNDYPGKVTSLSLIGVWIRPDIKKEFVAFSRKSDKVKVDLEGAERVSGQFGYYDAIKARLLLDGSAATSEFKKFSKYLKDGQAGLFAVVKVESYSATLDRYIDYLEYDASSFGIGK